MKRPDWRLAQNASLQAIRLFCAIFLCSNFGASLGGPVEERAVGPTSQSIQARLRWITIATSSLEQTEAYFARLSFVRTADTNRTLPHENSLLLAAPGPVRMMLLEMPGSDMAGLRLVGSDRVRRKPIRSKSKPSDYGFFDVAFSARDSQAIRDRLVAGGYHCKKTVEYDVPSPTRPRIRESLCQAPDQVNTVFLQRMGEQPKFELRGILSSVRTVADVDRSISTYRILGFEPRSDYIYDSEGVRHIVDLGPGFKLRIVMLESPWSGGARILLFRFLDNSSHPVRGKDLASREVPQNAGIYLWSFEVADVADAVHKMLSIGATLLSKPRHYNFPPYSDREAAVLQLPDGARVELIGTASSTEVASTESSALEAP